MSKTKDTLRGYDSPGVRLDYLSQLEPEEAEALLGRKIVAVDGREYTLTLTFDDGSTLEVHGRTYDDCSLGVEVSEPKVGA